MQRLNEEHNEGAEKKACNKNREESSIKRTQENRATKMEKVEEYKTVKSQCPVCGNAISSSPDMKKRSNKRTMNMAAQGTKICIFFCLSPVLSVGLSVMRCFLLARSFFRLCVMTSPVDVYSSSNSPM